MHPFRAPEPQQGFTLIEMLIVIVIVAIIAAVSAPSYQRFIANQRLKTASADLNFALIYARSEAIKRAAPVMVRSRSTADGCWSDGWDVVIDPVQNADGTFDGGTLVSEFSPKARVEIGATLDGAVLFSNQGRSLTPPIEFQVSASTITGTQPRCVGIDPSGASFTRVAACTTAVPACS